MPAANVIQLRQLLTGRFPGLRTHLDESAPSPRDLRPAGRLRMECLGVDLPAGALTEIVVERRGSGSALLLNALIQHVARANQLVALIDGNDSFDVTWGKADLSRLLWVRCRSAGEAMKAADLLLRDPNLPLVLLDLAGNPAGQVRKIPATTWYRFQRLVEQTSATGIVLTPGALVSPARVRLALPARFSLAALDRTPDELLAELKLNVSETRRAHPVRESLPNTA